MSDKVWISICSNKHTAYWATTYLFIQLVFIEHLLYANHYSKCLGYARTKQTKSPLPCGVYSLEGVVRQQNEHKRYSLRSQRMMNAVDQVEEGKGSVSNMGEGDDGRQTVVSKHDGQVRPHWRRRSEQRLETSQGVCLVEKWRKIIPRRGIKQRSNRIQYAHHVPGAQGQWGWSIVSEGHSRRGVGRVTGPCRIRLLLCVK